MADVLGKLSFLETPDVNGTLVLLEGGAVSLLSGTANEITVSGLLPSYTVGIADNAIFPGLGAVTIPSGTTAQQPTPTNGMFRYNTSKGNVEYYRPAAWVTQSGVLEKSVVTTSITATTESDLMNITVPANTLDANGIIRITIAGTINNASGATRSYTIRVRYGATVMYADTSATQATGTTVGFTTTLFFAANNSATAQTVNGVFHLGGTGAVTTGITGDLATDEILGTAILTGTSAINSATDQTLRVTIQPSGGNTTTNRYFYLAEIL